MDDRTPYEAATGLTGEDLEGYRAAKEKYRFKDPEFYTCPICKEVLIGAMGEGNDRCPGCRHKQRQAQIKNWQNQERKAADAKKPAGGLVDKVAKENERAGAEKAYPADND